MKQFLFALFSLLAFSVQADPLIQAGDTLGIAGDSITQQHLYSVMMEDYLLMCHPTTGQKVVNFGWSGEQASQFLGRLKSDVYPFKPTVMTTCYGMNDGHYGPLNDTTTKEYVTNQTAVVDSLKKNDVRVIVLGSAKCVDTYYYHRGISDPNLSPDVYNKTLAAMAGMDKDIAAKEGVVYADVFGTMTDVMRKAKAKFGEDYMFAGSDGVHPGANGQLVMAYTFLKALGYDGSIGTITVDMAGKQATAAPGQEIQSFQDGVVTVKSSRYPFCFTGKTDDKNHDFTAAVSTVFPFNDELNRFILVVKGVPGSKAKITWSNSSKEFSADQLAKGVNLAAEFYDNPFVAQFANVDGAVHHLREDETKIYQQYTQPMNDLKTNFAPGVDSAWDQIVQSAMQQREKLYKAAVALVVPITHTIKIEQEP